MLPAQEDVEDVCEKLVVGSLGCGGCLGQVLGLIPWKRRVLVSGAGFYGVSVVQRRCAVAIVFGNVVQWWRSIGHRRKVDGSRQETLRLYLGIWIGGGLSGNLRIDTRCDPCRDRRPLFERWPWGCNLTLRVLGCDLVILIPVEVPTRLPLT
ncbi:hypothetical protein BD413DRAFT_146230 [Trametes elegans]|nr:hypothetical protein BD413DRAFT_146230 [Trametes elegans]